MWVISVCVCLCTRACLRTHLYTRISYGSRPCVPRPPHPSTSAPPSSTPRHTHVRSFIRTASPRHRMNGWHLCTDQRLFILSRPIRSHALSDDCYTIRVRQGPLTPPNQPTNQRTDHPTTQPRTQPTTRPRNHSTTHPTNRATTHHFTCLPARALTVALALEPSPYVASF